MPHAARAQAYPSQDVNFICGFAAGSGADIIVRYFADKMRPLMNRTIIVQNKPGALGNIATEFVARSKPDGHTIYVTGANSVAANMHVFRKPPVDAGKAFQIAATINRATMMLAVRADAPWKTVADLTAAMKQKGDKASYAFANPTAKVLGAMYKERAGLQAVEVAYRTGADFLNELYGGKIDYAFPDNIQAMAQSNAGRMRILAVGAGSRMQAAPDLPTLTELGYPMDIRSWWAALVPAGDPESRSSTSSMPGSAGWSKALRPRRFSTALPAIPGSARRPRGRPSSFSRSRIGKTTCGSPRSSRRDSARLSPYRRRAAIHQRENSCKSSCSIFCPMPSRSTTS